MGEELSGEEFLGKLFENAAHTIIDSPGSGINFIDYCSGVYRAASALGLDLDKTFREVKEEKGRIPNGAELTGILLAKIIMKRRDETQNSKSNK